MIICRIKIHGNQFLYFTIRLSNGTNMVFRRIIFSITAASALFTGVYAQEKKVSLAFSIKEKPLIAEGIAYDKLTGAFYIGSIYKKKIIKADLNGTVSDFKGEREDGLLDVLGMKVDETRRILWVCSYAGGGNEKENGSAGIFKYDLKSGRLIKKYILKGNKGPHLFNDIAIKKNGDVYFTDSEESGIYKISAGKDMIEKFFPAGILKYPNGIVFSPDEKYLLAADNEGIHRIDMQGNRIMLKVPEGKTAGGCDGICFYQNSIVAVQNEHTPEQIVRFYLNNNYDTVERIDLLCANNPLAVIPTTGAIAGDQFFIIGNSQLDIIKEGKITSPEKAEETRIVRISLR